MFKVDMKEGKMPVKGKSPFKKTPPKGKKKFSPEAEKKMMMAVKGC